MVRVTESDANGARCILEIMMVHALFLQFAFVSNCDTMLVLPTWIGSLVGRRSNKLNLKLFSNFRFV